MGLELIATLTAEFGEEQAALTPRTSAEIHVFGVGYYLVTTRRQIHFKPSPRVFLVLVHTV